MPYHGTSLVFHGSISPIPPRETDKSQIMQVVRMWKDLIDRSHRRWPAPLTPREVTLALRLYAMDVNSFQV